ncbi:PQQ-like beta-propeller repeat protein [Streptomyces sp. APSN-46.1]|uniref:outer membrane protein assembly factor BamB family protein n=1 Tax=Streptomyces sp. APSN-46.1 TaxID=2929049 RepID=UPI001FB5551D|nr:PQQ-binding-like beta-propeller repeat protein [Streptomyces sp. APSN-46.1]MCJ1680628.1 PQQ-like beta-propeller repeat protein [Streptomyces sp. APSN-46.1]
MEQPTPPRGRITAHLSLVLASALAGVVVLYGVLTAKLALDAHAHAHGWPRGLGWLLMVLPLLAIATVAAGTRSAASGPRVTRFGGPAKAVAVLVALAALWPGWLGFEWMRGPHAYAWTWYAPDRPATARPLDAWSLGPTGMVRARSDALFLFNGEGRSGGTLRAPEGTSVCALSRTTPAFTGLVAYGRDAAGACGARVEAVDLRSSGGRLWGRDLSPAGGVPPVAVDGTAVVLDEAALLGLDLTSGTERWRAPLGTDCRVTALDGADGRILAVADCAGRPRLRALDAVTGRALWESPLAGTGRVLSVRPAAVQVPDGSVLLFDDTGRPRGSVAGLPTQPTPLAVGGLLIASGQGKKPGLSAYSLTDGRRVWHAGLDGHDVRGIAPGRAGGVDVVTSDRWWTYLWHLNGDSGAPGQRPTVLRDVPLGRRFEVYADQPAGYTFVNLDEGGRLPVYFSVRPVIGW